MKTSIKSALFALAIVATNWHWKREITAVPGSDVPGVVSTTTTVAIDGAFFWIVVCAVLLLALGGRLYKEARLLLDMPVRVPRDLQLFVWSPVAYLLPLFFGWSGTTIVPDGSTTTTTVLGYGAGSGGWESLLLFVLAALVIAVYQAREALCGYVPVSPKAS